MSNKLLFVFILSLFIGVSSCKKEPQLPHNKYEQKDSTQLKMAEMNRVLSDMEDKDIAAYIQKSELKFNTTTTGLRYFIKQNGSSVSIKKGDDITLAYKIRLLDGTLCYNYTEQRVTVGTGRHKKGLWTGLQLMSFGDEATFIVPSYMAYGALGDQDKIPPRAVLVYEIFSVKKN